MNPGDRHSPIYQGKSEALSFASTLKTVDFTMAAVRKEAVSLEEQVQEALREARARGEKEGFEVGKTRGYDEGYAEGLRVGAEEAHRQAAEMLSEQLSQIVEEFNRIAADMNGKIGEWFENSERQMASLAMIAVQKLLKSELEISRDSVLEIVKDALREVTHSRHVRIKVNPFDSVILRERRQEVLAAAENLRDVEIVSDPTISGGCMIEGDGGAVDATLETKLILMEDSFRRAA